MGQLPKINTNVEHLTAGLNKVNILVTSSSLSQISQSEPRELAKIIEKFNQIPSSLEEDGGAPNQLRKLKRYYPTKRSRKKKFFCH